MVLAKSDGACVLWCWPTWLEKLRMFSDEAFASQILKGSSTGALHGLEQSKAMFWIVFPFSGELFGCCGLLFV